MNRVISASVLLSLYFLLPTSAQSSQNKDLPNIVLSKYSDALFVCVLPIKKVRLKLPRTYLEMRYMFKPCETFTDKTIDTALISCILSNVKDIDTTAWTEAELPKHILVASRDAYVSKRHIIKRFDLDDRKLARQMKRKMSQFNLTPAIERNIYYVSRPVFDDTKTFAIIQWDNGHSQLGGGGGIVLYHFEGGYWKEVCPLMGWKY